MTGPLVLHLAAVLRLVLVLTRTRAQEGVDSHPVARLAGLDLLAHHSHLADYPYNIAPACKRVKDDLVKRMSRLADKADSVVFKPMPAGSLP